MIELFSSAMERIVRPETVLIVLRIIAVLAVGFLLLKLLLYFVGRAMKKRLSPQSEMLVRKTLFYTVAFIILVTVLRLAGFKLTALLGAAGIAGIAIGFASQTSVSNIISGLFLISEKPFTVGDIIKVGNTLGIILSIDLLSLKLRTFDNLYIRIPNEQLIKSEVINITRFPIRRLDIMVSVAYKEDLGRVRELLLEIARNNPQCLDTPEPLFLIREFGNNGIELLFGVWFSKPDYLVVKNSLMLQIKERFDAQGIEIPFPHLSLYTGAATSPLPVRLVEGAPFGEGLDKKPVER